MVIVTRAFDWSDYDLRRMASLATVGYLVIHHTASPDVPVEEIDRWHRGRGWVGVGYHYLVRADGTVEKGRPDDKQGAHVLGYNDKSLGIAVAGNFVSEPPPDRQFESLVRLVNGLKMEYPIAHVVRHRDLQATDCPGDAFPWDEFLTRLKRYGEEQAAGPAPRVEDWKAQIVQDARAWNLITQDHDPDEPAPKWFVLAVALNALKVIKSK